MSNEEPEKNDRIWKFVLEHQEYFCDPPPEGLGFPMPGMIPGHYLKRPEEWPLDRIRVLRLKRERQLRDGTRNRTVSTGTATATRQFARGHQQTRPGGAHRGGHIRPDGRDRGRGPQRPGPGAGG